MRTQLICLLFSGSLISGCASVPELPRDYGVSVAEIVSEIRCELAELSNQRIVREAPLGWIAGVNLKLETLTDASIDTKAGLSVPLTPGTLVATVGGTYQGSAKSISEVEFQEKLTITAPACRNDTVDIASGGLNGNLGISTWMEKLQTAVYSTKIEPIKLTYTVEFIVTASGNLGPKFALLPIGNSTVEASAALTGKKQRTNKMTLVLTKKTPDKPDKAKKAVIDLNNKRELEQTIQSQSGNDL